MASTKQKNGKLNFNWGLGGVGVIVENVVGTDLVGDAVKGVWVNVDSSPVLFDVASAPVFKERELWRLLDCRVPA